MKRLIALVALSLPLGVLSLPNGGCAQQEREVREIPIGIEEVVIDEDVQDWVRVVVPPVYVSPGDVLTWDFDFDGRKLEWAVHFPAPSPLVRIVDGRVVPVRRVRFGDPPVQIREDNPAGKYNYFVAVQGPDGKIYTEDPPLIDEGDEG